MTSRRTFMGQSAAAASALAFPLVGGAQPKPIKVGVLHPVTGALAYSGQQCRMGALMAIEDINKAGGIKSLGGAKIEAMLGDAQSSPQAGTAEIEKMNEAGVSAVVGAFASAICLATTQAAAKYNLPHVVDVGVADQIVERGLKNTFRFGPGYKKCAEVAVASLHALNTAADGGVATLAETPAPPEPGGLPALPQPGGLPALPQPVRRAFRTQELRQVQHVPRHPLLGDADPAWPGHQGRQVRCWLRQAVQASFSRRRSMLRTGGQGTQRLRNRRKPLCRYRARARSLSKGTSR